ncbi:MAG TPA: NRAMP family divalent metal transporter [Gemmatimonadales bacterium]
MTEGATPAAPAGAPATGPLPRAAARSRAGVLLGAAFLMATSAIGPGFLTQTVVFTQQLGASFGFAILASVLVDLVAQVSVWRVVAASRLRAPAIADGVAPGLGMLLAALVALGGLAFNIGNVAGAGLGLQAALGLPVLAGACLSAALAIALFLVREAGRAMDRFAQLLGGVMILLVTWVAFASRPPLAEAALRTVLPESIGLLAIITIVGGTVGGYITFAGAHRLLDAGVSGAAAIGDVTRSATRGVIVASTMRVLLFLAALGVVARGAVLDPANPPASVFQVAAGAVGLRLFGVVMWSAAITSVVGSAYTSVSFLRAVHPAIDRAWTRVVVGFILVSTLVFALVGRPVKVLVLAGALNGLILPVALGVMLVAARRPAIVGAYRHPRALALAGAVVVILMSALGGWTLVQELPRLFR